MHHVFIVLTNCTAVNPMLVSSDIKLNAIIALDFLRAHQLMMDPNNSLLFYFPDQYYSYKRQHTRMVQHEIITGSAPPQRQPPRRIPFYYQTELNSIISHLLSQVIIEPSNCPWADTVILVKKKNGNPRLCVEKQKLNKIIVLDSLPIRRINDTPHM
ncbi:unnamed protein product [Dibothriocephalus latus]|uniref:Uncharacterized protein n=1 Tax=Dibothriocephalus latus TaxID=60516 RepID=A0A3P6QNU8_DIBLA|nr:unnamed protein product [Dibothriocephalus latus]